MILEPKIINSTNSRRKQKAILERFTFTSETTDRIKTNPETNQNSSPCRKRAIQFPTDYLERLNYSTSRSVVDSTYQQLKHMYLSQFLPISQSD